MKVVPGTAERNWSGGAGAAGLVVGRALYGGRIEAGMLEEKVDGWEA